ncbi:MAG: hypothetical protein KJ906_00345 [Nanoarchaeota archaeon]|nr:hypothetical protein [Nanoarchaeota archaeon]
MSYHDSPMDDIRDLEILSWFEDPSVSYREVRETIKQFDYEELEVVGKKLYQKFDTDRTAGPPRPLALANFENDIYKYTTEIAKRTNANSFGMMTGPCYVFGSNFLTEDLIRIYISPDMGGMSGDAPKKAIKEIFESCQGLGGQIKLHHVGEWSREDGRSADATNKIVLYFDRYDKQFDKILHKLATSDLTSFLEEKGTFQQAYTLPIAPGICMVEGSLNSWDTEIGQAIVDFKYCLSGKSAIYYDRFYSDLISRCRIIGIPNQQIQTILNGTETLEAIGRVHKMPALKNDVIDPKKWANIIPPPKC